jgi:hypothetical protein
MSVSVVGFSSPKITTVTVVGKLSENINTHAFFSSIYDLMTEKGFHTPVGKLTRPKTMTNFKTGRMIHGSDLYVRFRNISFINPHGNKVSNFKHNVCVWYPSMLYGTERKLNMKIFSNGSIQATGYMHPKDVYDDIPYISECLKDICPSIFYHSQNDIFGMNIRMVMMNAIMYKYDEYQIRTPINFENLLHKEKIGLLGENTRIHSNQELNPGRFVIKFLNKKVSLICTFKGSVTFTCSDEDSALEELEYMYSFCKQHMC